MQWADTHFGEKLSQSMLDSAVEADLGQHKVDRVVHIPKLTLLKIFWLIVLAIISFLHFGSPLYCGIHAIGDEGNINWVSTCQFFVWRMMTRSTRVHSLSFRLMNDKTKQIDHLNPAALGMRDIQGLAYYEDMLLRTAHQVRSHAISSTPDQTPPSVFADLWIEINGPPAQRYVDPNIDLVKAAIVHPKVYFVHTY